MTNEARLGFVLFFFAVWFFLGLMSWAIAAVSARGRGALPALPLALAAASAAGVIVPLVGWRDAAGFFMSLVTALIGGAAGSVIGIALARRFEAGGLSTDTARLKGMRSATGEPASDAETD